MKSSLMLGHSSSLHAGQIGKHADCISFTIIMFSWDEPVKKAEIINILGWCLCVCVHPEEIQFIFLSNYHCRWIGFKLSNSIIQLVLLKIYCGSDCTSLTLDKETGTRDLNYFAYLMQNLLFHLSSSHSVSPVLRLCVMLEGCPSSLGIRTLQWS